MMLYGVDVHDGYQTGLSFATLRRQGYAFATVKLTEGTSYERPLADEWVRAARAAGLIAGGYHWIDRSDGAAQARWFHRKVLECGGPAGMLIQLDCEDNATLTDVRAWATEWNRLSGGHPFLLYTGGWWWRPRGWDGNSITPYLWDSHYLTADADSTPDDPAAFAARIPASWWTPGYGNWPGATVLQFTYQGDAGGLANNVDLNATRLTRAQLLALTTSGDDMALRDDGDGVALIYRVLALIGNLDMAEYTLPDGTRRSEPNRLKAAIAALQLPNVDASAVAAALAANQDFLAALAKAVNDDAAARLRD